MGDDAPPPDPPPPPPHRHNENGAQSISSRLNKLGQPVGLNVTYHCACGLPVRTVSS